MKLIIELPDEFEEHFDSDKFQDSFTRICVDIDKFQDSFTRICVDIKECLCGNYEYELASELKRAFSKAEKLKEAK